VVDWSSLTVAMEQFYVEVVHPTMERVMITPVRTRNPINELMTNVFKNDDYDIFKNILSNKIKNV
jgi:hypothetical protein